MKNPVAQLLHCWRWWKRLQPQGYFRWSDAKLQINRVILPARFAYQKAGEELKKVAKITARDEHITRIDLPEHQLHFYWHGTADNNLYFLIEQEFNPRNPHCYTTPPIHLTERSRVIDVGACEGLFAYRLLKQNLCQEVICFEPLRAMATLIWQSAVENGVADRLKVEPVAVAESSGPVRLIASDSPDAYRIEAADSETQEPDTYAVKLDEYFDNHQITLRSKDLIKIDAEGADLAVLQGSAETIARDQPQIAVTTYHADEHVEEITALLKKLNPGYRFRLKGFAHWTSRPRPVLLQAANAPTKG
ncbi:MAG: hypothetical protein M2R45_04515 [Verrucomicrobia subdivision 3 bacterium]|nr:hypothetical protein [Limisphaerales bacterium]MCS1415938.1 hypothetical protein [Limisphaerales bacterium]